MPYPHAPVDHHGMEHLAVEPIDASAFGIYTGHVAEDEEEEN